MVLPDLRGGADRASTTTPPCVVDADGTILGKYRKHHIPNLDKFWEKFYFRPGNLGYPVFDTAVGKVGVYICYDRHFPEGWRELGLNGAQIVFNPNATKPGLSNRLWEVEQPARGGRQRLLRAAAQPRRPRGQRVRRRAPSTSTARARSSTRAATSSASAARGEHEEVAHPRPRPGHGPRDARRLAVLPRPPPRVLHRDREAVSEGANHDHDPHHGRHRRQRDRAQPPPTCSSTARRSSPCCSPGSALLGTDLAASVDTVIDATGKYVIPGGIDAHTHMELPFGGTEACDTFETGTRAAAWGGTTTIIDFAVQTHGERVEDGLAPGTRRPPATARSTTASTRSSATSTTTRSRRWTRCVDEGITSFKLFMAYPGVFYSDDAQILQAMQKAARHRAAHDDARRERPGHRRARRAARRAGQDRPVLPRHRARLADGGGGDAPRDHARRPHRRSALRRARQRQAGRRAARRARDKGQNVFGETCPQYLYLSLEEQLGASSEEWGSFEGAKWVCSTPLRSRAEGHQDAHVAGAAHQRPADGLDRPLPVLHEGPEGARARRLPQDPERHRLDRAPDGPACTRASSPARSRSSAGSSSPRTTPARMFGLYGQKGVIQPGRRRRHRASTTRTATPRSGSARRTT